jgi:hypothetical protein
MNASIRAAIVAIGEGGWTPIRCPRAIRDDQPGSAGMPLLNRYMPLMLYVSFAIESGEGSQYGR